MKIYDRDNLHECSWPQTEDGSYARLFLSPLVEKGVSHYIENIQTDLRVLRLDDLAIPITINQTEYDNAYVCSPYSFFISYAQESLEIISQSWLRSGVNSLLNIFGKIFRGCYVNKAVVVNNWMLATNLYPQINSQQIQKIAQFLQTSFPDHAIVFRSVDEVLNPDCYETLQHEGFEYIATRQIFFLNSQETTFFDSRLFKSDLKLLETSDYEMITEDGLEEKDIPRLVELYRNVYVHKYSQLNPQFSEEFVRLTLKKRLFSFRALKKEGKIEGVVGFFERNGKMYCPFFGYDIHLPKETALYRLLSTVLMLEARKKGRVFHQSSGASAFKKMRKGESVVEYTAVYLKHLNFKRRLPWILTQKLYNSIGMKYMQRY